MSDKLREIFDISNKFILLTGSCGFFGRYISKTFLEVGAKPAIVVGIVDLGKGAAAVAIAYWLLDVSPLFVMLAGLASAIGHMWMIFLKFSGGKGMGAIFGALAVLLPV